MIVATMNGKEVLDVMKRDSDRVIAWAVHREKELFRELRKSRREIIAKSYDYHTDNADYIIILKCNKNGYVSRLRFAFIKETLEYVVLGTANGIRGMISYSVHLLKRYAERVLHDKSMPIHKVLLKFSFEDASVCIYNDNKFFVVAKEKGICLGEYDSRRDIVIHKTFVSFDLLKETQFQAWNKISDYITKVQKLRLKHGLYSSLFQSKLGEIQNEVLLSVKDVQAIYGSYYKELYET